MYSYLRVDDPPSGKTNAGLIGSAVKLNVGLGGAFGDIVQLADLADPLVVNAADKDTVVVLVEQ